MLTDPAHLKSGNTSDHVMQPASDLLPPIIDNFGVEGGEFTFENCEDVHIGPRYENSNNIIINQNISVPSEVLSHNLENVIKEKLQSPTHDCEVKNGFANYHCILLNSIVIAVIFLTVVMTMISFSFNKPDKEKGSITNDNPEARVTTLSIIKHSDDYPMDLQFVTRESWGAAQPLEQQKNNSLPLRRIIFIHTVSGNTCNKFRSCVEVVRSIQDLHMDEDHGWGDIGYNFLLGSDGYIYVGVGWDLVGAHSAGFNTGSLGVAFIGDFRTDEPNQKMISSAIRLLEFGVKRKKLSEDYQLFGHCQIMAGFPFSPGKNIMNVIKNWDHWNDTKINNCK